MVKFWTALKVIKDDVLTGRKPCCPHIFVWMLRLGPPMRGHAHFFSRVDMWKNSLRTSTGFSPNPWSTLVEGFWTKSHWKSLEIAQKLQRFITSDLPSACSCEKWLDLANILVWTFYSSKILKLNLLMKTFWLLSNYDVTNNAHCRCSFWWVNE